MDSSWGIESRGGYIFTCNQSPIVWSSFRLKSATMSSMEAEFMACSQATQEALWLRQLNADMGYGDVTIKQFGKLCGKDFVKAKL